MRRGVEQLLARAGVRPVDITAPIVHATTLITNALIEGKTGRAGLVTTAGFGDTLLIRDEHRYDMYDLQIEFPAPPIPRELTFELDERTGAEGVVLRTPDAAALDALDGGAGAADVEAVGVCFLNSYVNADNERLVADHLRRELGVPVCISAEVSPQIREYPRMVTTACNAATMPVIGPYLDELQKWLSGEGFGGSVLMMLSNGGVVSADDAARIPIRLVESRPGRRRARRHVVRRPPRRRPAAVLRHGRHDGQGVPHRARRARRSRTRSRSAACTGSRRAPGSRCRCRRSTSSRSVPAAARSPASTTSAC